ncbi:MAG: beta-lactamase family protein, partial [Deltaproteobacteria bacterium]|nr:beta-lactamase family protein [Deltaproteobacteria bacterium]
MRVAAAAALWVLFASACIGAPAEGPAVLDEPHEAPRAITHVVGPPRTLAELRARIAAILEREGVPGVAFAVVGPRETYAGGVGVANVATRVPMGADTVVRAASITKSIVGLGVMKLVEEGRLRLDRPLRETLPDAGIDNAWEGTSPVTLAQVLEHTAGLDDMRPNETFVDDDAMSTGVALSLNERSRRIRWRPGTRPAYSNVGYTLAARAIEVATGVPFDAWLRQHVTIPLGMRDADFRRTDVLAARLATGYRDTGGSVAEFRPIAHRPAGALLASASDLAKLVQFWLRRGEGFPHIVTEAGLRRIERSGTMPYPHMDIEYGLGNYGDVAHPVKGRGHDGGLPGFLSCLRYFPELDAGYVMLLNSTTSRNAYIEIRALLFGYLARDHALPPDEPEPRTLPPEGFYGFAAPRHALFGFLDRALLGWRARPAEGGARVDSLLGPGLELVATNDGGYRLVGQSGTSIRFTENRDGERVMVGLVAYAEEGSWTLARARVRALAAALFLLELAPWWAAFAIALSLARRRRIHALDLAPALAAIALPASVYVLGEAAERQLLGEVNAWTLGLCAATLVFGLASLAALAAAVHAAVR